MVGVLDLVNQCMQLVGQNCLELFLFCLDGNQFYGINVFKVKEVLQCLCLMVMFKFSLVVCGVVNICGGIILIFDLVLVIGCCGLQDLINSFVIIIEYNIKVQGFLVCLVECIVNMNWEEIYLLFKGVGCEYYLIVVIWVDKQLVEIIDVEKVFVEVVLMFEEVFYGVVDVEIQSCVVIKWVLVVDDLLVVCKQVICCLEVVGVEMIVFNDGCQVLEYLQNMFFEGWCLEDELLMLIFDIEMLEMDGYILMVEICSDFCLQKLYIFLYILLFGVFNQVMVKKVGVDDFFVKFCLDDLVVWVVEWIKVVDVG